MYILCLSLLSVTLTLWLLFGLFFILRPQLCGLILSLSLSPPPPYKQLINVYIKISTKTKALFIYFLIHDIVFDQCSIHF